MLKSDVELPASNAKIPAHMSAPPEKTQKLQATPLTCHPNVIPTHRNTPNRSIRHSMHLPTQSHSPSTTHGSSSHPSNKCSSDQCCPRAAVGSKQKRRAAKPQNSATTGCKSTERSHSNEFSPNALNLPPSPTKAPRDANQTPRQIKSLCNTK
ncbi:hypothetical protein TcCL_NonESM09191 [Trypanosoma cruzi]|nr:hypothetical protein TcCL_NonESM09191 [Trypanosoma cruzi]